MWTTPVGEHLSLERGGPDAVVQQPVRGPLRSGGRFSRASPGGPDATICVCAAQWGPGPPRQPAQGCFFLEFFAGEASLPGAVRQV
eukprot:4643051-Lingulodinium_polyedra.AAC.1